MDVTELKRKVLECYFAHIHDFSDEVTNKYGIEGELDFELDCKIGNTPIKMSGCSKLCLCPEYQKS